MCAMSNEHLLTDSTRSACDNATLRTRDILGIPVSVATPEEALRFLIDRLQKNVPTCVSFLNANNSNLAANHPALAKAFRSFVVFNDGIGVDIASYVLHGKSFPYNLNGTDFVPWFLQNTSHALRVFILGGNPGIPQRVHAEFQRIAPQHKYVGSQHGYFQEHELPGIISSIINAKTDLLIVGFGTPSQELWLANQFSATRCRLAFCVGGLLDFVSGAKPRAPLWLRRIRQEWIYRLFLEPGRMWRRYLFGNVRFLIRLAHAAIKKNKEQPVDGAHLL